MFVLDVTQNAIRIRQADKLVSGSVNVYPVRFSFSEGWDNLTKIVTFCTDKEKQSVLLETDECQIPWEVLTTSGKILRVGVLGRIESTIILPTVWARLGCIQKGVSTDGTDSPPTLDIWEQRLALKQDKLKGLPGQIAGFDDDGNLAAVDMPSIEEGTMDHRMLTHRDALGQHSIESITGLKETLNTIPGPVEALTNEELEELLK